MKKILTLILCFVLLLSLAACGGNTSDEPAAQPDVPVADTPVADEPADEPVADTPVADQPADEPAADEDTAEDLVELARTYIDKPIEELYAVIGEPQSSDYAPSCLGDGDDGMLFYDGFIVYTYREGDTETVYDVE